MKALLNRDSVWPAGIQTCLAVATSGSTAQLAAAADNQSILLIWTLPLPQLPGPQTRRLEKI
jgi:hypothetical protein